jgi:hypothetical protein
MYYQFLYQHRMMETESKQLLDYIETLFSAYIEIFLALSVIVLILIAWLCARELKVASKPARTNNNSYISSYERMIEDHSSTC